MCDPKPSRRPRSTHSCGASSDTTTARPATTADPANSPPNSIRASKCEINVVLPDFQRLVSSVIAPEARYPCQCHCVLGGAFAASSLNGMGWSDIVRGQKVKCPGVLAVAVGE